MEEEEAGMQISIPKTKAQNIMPTPKVSETTEADVEALPPEMQLKFECDKNVDIHTETNMDFPFIKASTAKTGKQSDHKTEKEPWLTRLSNGTR